MGLVARRAFGFSVGFSAFGSAAAAFFVLGAAAAAFLVLGLAVRGAAFFSPLAGAPAAASLASA
ncbi:MAG TPA: hypothetical protein VIN32_01365, partial [Candidatus Limnocylindria bacterium]